VIGGPDHGTVVPVTFALKCDVPKCEQRLDLIRPATGVLEELTSKQALRAEAEANGWYVTCDRGALNQNWDLCPAHAPPSSMRVAVAPTAFSLSVVGGSILLKKETP
jgi:hypothetical protein